MEISDPDRRESDPDRREEDAISTAGERETSADSKNALFRHNAGFCGLKKMGEM